MDAIEDDLGIIRFERYAFTLLSKWFPRIKGTASFERFMKRPHLQWELFNSPQIPLSVKLPTSVDLSDPDVDKVPEEFHVVNTKDMPQGLSPSAHAEELRRRTSVRKPVGGKLAALPEAAGKVRIIAIVDAWTQTYLTPVHDYFFRLLKKVPQDATFDQQGAVSNFAKKGLKNLFSFDLSAATDTIPWTLYQAIMKHLLPVGVSDAWLALLRDREWLLPMWKEPDEKHPKRLQVDGKSFIKYNRGQPMGARSSFGALALVHHALVQFAADSIFKAPFDDYLILGDDIVIGDYDVAMRYKVLASALGVKIGLPKSFQSMEGFFNFANQSYLGDVNLSPISFKEELAQTGLLSRLETLWKVVARGVLDISKADFLSKALRWLVDPHLLRRIEDSRMSGVLHEAAHKALTLIFTSGLEGNKAFKPLEGLTVRDIAGTIVSPKLSLFCLGVKPSESLTRNKGWIWSTNEYLLALIDRLVIELYRELHLRQNILRLYIGLPAEEKLVPFELCSTETLEQIAHQQQWEVTPPGLYSRILFGQDIHMPSEAILSDGTRVKTDSYSQFIESFPSLLLGLAQDTFREFNATIYHLGILSTSARKCHEIAPHMLEAKVEMDLYALETLRQKISLNFRTPSESSAKTSIAPDDRSVIEMMCLTDSVRTLARLGVKDHTVNPSSDSLVPNTKFDWKALAGKRLVGLQDFKTFKPGKK
jgi:hypothetical protein